MVGPDSRPGPLWLAGIPNRLMLGLAVLLFLTGTSPAQDGPAVSDQLQSTTDVVVKIVNGTTGEPGRADVVTLRLRRSTLGPLDSGFVVREEVTFYGLDLVDYQEYIVEATLDDIPYYATAKGRELGTGPLTVHVFDTTGDLSGLEVVGMNLILRRGESELDVEYLISLANNTVPQQTIVGSPASLEMALPPAAHDKRLEIVSRPHVAEMPLGSARQAGWTGLQVPFPPGQSRLRLTFQMPYEDEAEIPIGFSLPVANWSILAFPFDLSVRGFGLEQTTGTGDADYSRFMGSELEAGRELVLTVSGGTAPEVSAREEAMADSLFGTEEVETVEADEQGSSVVWILIFVLLVVLYLAIRRRGQRRTQSDPKD
jgi:hypothetical protein